MEPALITAISTLIGTLIGAGTSILSTRWSYEAQRRRDARAATRLVLSELRTNTGALRQAIASKSLQALKEGPPSYRQWELHRDVLAAELPTDDWLIVEKAQRSIAGVIHIVSRSSPLPSWSEHQEMLDHFFTRAVDALGALQCRMTRTRGDLRQIGLDVLR